MENAHYEINNPFAPALIESLRAFGYSPEAAIADLIDNSITAGAREIEIGAHWKGRHTHIYVMDNGEGMSEAALVDAMRLGSRSPLEERSSRDLGRFGLGLKTASFSQARRLTVWSRREGLEAVRIWDLDYVSDTEEWRLLKEPDVEEGALLEPLSRNLVARSGTVVLWRFLDRIVGDVDTDDTKAHDAFLAVLERIKNHIAMIFHRFIEDGTIRILMNGHQVSAWDPFMTREAATQHLPFERIPYKGSAVGVRPFVLPHTSRLTPEKHNYGAGVRGWNAHQGFYVYRGRRMLVAGSWLSLGFRREEHAKLARIAVDFTNDMDNDWVIDVRKSHAVPPLALRERLRQIARLTRTKAIDIYRHRGKSVAMKTSSPRTFIWTKRVRQGKTFYRINREHPIVSSMVLEDKQKGAFENILRALEETVPVPLIVLTASEEPEGQAAPFEGVPSSEIRMLASAAIANLAEAGSDRNDIVRQLLSMEPFMYFREIVMAVIEVELGSEAEK